MKLIQYLFALIFLFSNPAFSESIKNTPTTSPTQKPNIVIIWGDDI